jgi:predicted amidohydrolase YtcJ
MPRYLVQRSFAHGIESPFIGESAGARVDVIEQNAALGVTWLHSYVSEDQQTTYCVYDAPDPEAIRKAASRNGLPVDVITRVSVLDPYGYRSPRSVDSSQ